MHPSLLPLFQFTPSYSTRTVEYGIPRNLFREGSFFLVPLVILARLSTNHTHTLTRKSLRAFNGCQVPDHALHYRLVVRYPVVVKLGRLRLPVDCVPHSTSRPASGAGPPPRSPACIMGTGRHRLPVDRLGWSSELTVETEQPEGLGLVLRPESSESSRASTA